VSGPILLAAAVLSAGVSWLVVAFVRDVALRRGLLDVPNARSSHARPTPRLGGLGLVAGVLASTGLALAFGLGLTRAVPVIGAAVAVAGLSLVDDLRGLPAVIRLVFHIAAASGVLWSVGGFDEVVVAGEPLWSGTGIAILSPALAAVVTVVWIVAFVNAFNFMDGIDGIAALQAVVAGLAWTAIGWLLDEPALALLGAAVAAAASGLLAHNWSPASIFMGDVGSAFLGILLAAAPLTTRPPRGLLIPAVLTVWPFVFDTSITLARRARRRENLFAAHRSHLYQRLTQAGWSHAAVATLYGALAAGGALLAVAVASGRAIGAPAAVISAGIAAAVLWGTVVRAERLQDRSTVPAIEDSSRA
jgi:Fuc2NAc and GlcNAc transferase